MALEVAELKKHTDTGSKAIDEDIGKLRGIHHDTIEIVKLERGDRLDVRGGFMRRISMTLWTVR